MNNHLYYPLSYNITDYASIILMIKKVYFDSELQGQGVKSGDDLLTSIGSEAVQVISWQESANVISVFILCLISHVYDMCSHFLSFVSSLNHPGVFWTSQNILNFSCISVQKLCTHIK